MKMKLPKGIKTIKPQHDTKTHHKTGYHKPERNPTTNAAPDTHKVFCKRCYVYNGGCPGNMKTCNI